MFNTIDFTSKILFNKRLLFDIIRYNGMVKSIEFQLYIKIYRYVL